MAELQAFFNAVLNGDDATVGAWLAESPAVAQMKFDGATALHCAALENRRAVVDLLLAHGADLNVVDDEFGSTPLRWANEKGHVEMTAYLAARGAAVDFHTAAACGMVERVANYLLAGADINEQKGFGTPLHEACVWGHPEVVALLIAHAADLNLKNRARHTPLLIAAHQVASNAGDTPIVHDERRKEIIAGCQEVVRLLRKHGALME